MRIFQISMAAIIMMLSSLHAQTNYDGEWVHSWFGSGASVRIFVTNTHVLLSKKEAYRGEPLNILDLAVFENSAPSKSDCIKLHWIYDPDAPIANTWVVAVIAPPSWTPFDIDGMKALVFMVKGNVNGLDMSVSILDKKKNRASAGCMSKYIRGGETGTEWKQVVIPLDESFFSGFSQLDTTQINAISFEDSTCRASVESVQKDCVLYLDNIAFKRKLK